VLPQSIELV
jgi:hypothetical protein